MRWFFPSYRGDFRLEQRGADARHLVLTVTSPTDHERAVLTHFLAKSRQRGWTNATAVADGETILCAAMASAGKLLLKCCKPKKTTLTVVRCEDGKVRIEESEPSLDNAAAAVSVARPTLCCPRCTAGPLDAATEVLFEFCDEAQRVGWKEHHALVCEGGTTGHRYLLAHRHSPVAKHLGWICRDLDDEITLHFHDAFVPPPEEVLAAKLMLEHRESWLRNEASMYHLPDRYERLKNPFGDWRDGMGTATTLRMIGSAWTGAKQGVAGLLALHP